MSLKFLKYHWLFTVKTKNIDFPIQTLYGQKITKKENLCLYNL